MLNNLSQQNRRLNNRRELEFIKQQSIKNINPTSIIKVEEEEVLFEEIYKKDDKEEFTNLLKQLSTNRNIKKKR